MKFTGSIQPGKRFGKPHQAGTISKVIGQIRTERTLGAGYKICGIQGTGDLIVRQMKHMRFGDGPPSVRTLELGFRARHFKLVAQSSFDRISWWGVVRWAFCRLAYRCCGRGGEMGAVDETPFDVDRGLTWAAFRWHEPADPSAHSILIVFYMAIKDGKLTNVRVPIPIVRKLPRSDTRRHPYCVYDAMRAAWDMQAPDVPAQHAGYCQEGCVSWSDPREDYRCLWNGGNIPLGEMCGVNQVGFGRIVALH